MKQMMILLTQKYKILLISMDALAQSLASIVNATGFSLKLPSAKTLSRSNVKTCNTQPLAGFVAARCQVHSLMLATACPVAPFPILAWDAAMSVK